MFNMETIFMNTENSKLNELHKSVLNLSQRLVTNEFELPDGSYSVSHIQDYIEYIIKKQETLTTIPPIHVYINRIDRRLVFNTKDGYKLELQTPKTIKLFGSTKKLIEITQNGENVPNLEVAEVV